MICLRKSIMRPPLDWRHGVEGYARGHWEWESGMEVGMGIGMGMGMEMGIGMAC